MNYQKQNPSFFRLITSFFRTNPSFIIVGASRCGTTTLFDYLITNKACQEPLSKEIGFFHKSKSFLWYKSYFPITNKMSGESSPNYFIDPVVPMRIKKSLPNIKIIILIRNPVDRAFSHYSMNVSSKLETKNFEEALELEDARIKTKVNKFIFSYKTTGRYIEHISNWKRYFDSHQMMIINYDDINSSETKKKLCSFVNIPYEDRELKKLSLVSKNTIPPKIKRKLGEYFQPYNEKLYQYVGKNLAWD